MEGLKGFEGFEELQSYRVTSLKDQIPNYSQHLPKGSPQRGDVRRTEGSFQCFWVKGLQIFSVSVLGVPGFRALRYQRINAFRTFNAQAYK